MTDPARDVVWIGDWRLDPAIRRLERGDEAHRLEPKMLDVLLLLAEGAGQPVGRRELERAVWSGAAVGTDLLNRTIWKLRRVLGDDPSHPRYIETIPRVGYRMVAPVRRGGSTEAEVTSVGRANETGRSRIRSAPLPGVAGLLVLAALAVGWVVLGRGVSEERSPPGRIEPLTATPGYEAAPDLSPDGRTVAYQRYDPSEPNATWDIELIDVGDRSVRVLAGRGDAHEYAPAWSPTGDSIAFVRQNASGCEIVVANLEAGERVATKCAVDQGHEVAWVDGSLVLASSAPGQTLGLWRIGPGGAHREALTFPPAGQVGDGRPRVSPDGSRIAFVRSRTEGVEDLFVLDRRAADPPSRLTHDARRIGGLAWDPDGTRILFSSTRGGDSHLWSVSASGGSPTRVAMSGRNASRLTARPGVLVYEEYFGDSDLWSYDPATGALEAWAGSSRSEWGVSVSPDGRQVAYLSDRTGAAEVWVSPADQPARAVRITRLLGAAVDPPRWSPDGSVLVFAAALDGTFDVFTVPATGGEPRRVTTHPGDERVPEWWGEDLVFSAYRTGATELWRVAAGGGLATRITAGGGWGARAAPDAEALYFTRPDEPGIWRLSRATALPIRIWADFEPSNWGNWTPTRGGLLRLRAQGPPGAVLERLDLVTGAIDTLVAVPGEVPDRAGVAAGTITGEVLFSRVVRSESDLWSARGRFPGGG